MTHALVVRATRLLCRGVLAALRIEVRHEGAPADRPTHDGPALWVANHLSWIDIVAMLGHHQCTFVAKDDVRRWPLVGTLGRALGVIWIDRTRKRDLLRTIPLLGDALRSGRRVILFPEGTTTLGHSVLPFRSSLVEAAVQAGVPVVPVALSVSADRGGGETLCWVGDETLWAHLQRLVSVRGAVFTIRVLPALAPGPSRKVQSHAARACIVTARRQPAAQRAVAWDASAFAKQNFRPMDSSDLEIAR
jgi:1-acyl-sn-glycerol-3-phosphate acyltransferase